MSKKIFSGTVLSAKNPNTLIVEVVLKKTSKLYGKKYISKKKYHVHYKEGNFLSGDSVSFVHSRTYSATKKWEVLSDACLAKLKTNKTEAPKI